MKMTARFLARVSRHPNDNRVHWLAWALLGLLLAALPWLVASGFGNTWLRILNFALLYVMLALGLNIVVGFAGLLDMGYIAFYAVGAYLWALLASPQFGLHWPLWAILISYPLAGWPPPAPTRSRWQQAGYNIQYFKHLQQK